MVSVRFITKKLIGNHSKNVVLLSKVDVSTRKKIVEYIVKARPYNYDFSF